MLFLMMIGAGVPALAVPTQGRHLEARRADHGRRRAVRGRVAERAAHRRLRRVLHAATTARRPRRRSGCSRTTSRRCTSRSWPTIRGRRDIRAPLVDRDKVLGDQDYVAILIDTLNDRRSGVAFRVNPRGVQTDSVVNDANGEEDFSPDFFYEAVARRTERGWTAEMRIPLASLRYPSTDPQTWGVIMMRNYPRDYRYIMANTPIPKNSGCFLCHASEVAGLEGLPTGSHFTIAPYTTAAQTRAARRRAISRTTSVST